MIDRLRRDPGLALALGAVVAVLVLYASTFGYGLVNYDDPTLYENNWIVQHASWSSISTIFFDLDPIHREVLTPEYLPIRDLSVMLDFAIWGHWYHGFHITNVALYIASIGLWFRALTAFGIDRRIAGLAVLLWAIHPSHAESVAWLAERKGVLGVMFAGVCALGYARFRVGRSAGWLVLAMVTAVFAVWSKAPTAFAIGSLAGLELVLPQLRQSWRRSLVGLGAIGLVAAAAYIPVVMMALSGSIVGTEAPVGDSRLALIFGVHGFYLRMAAMVTTNAISYPLSIDGPSTADIVLGAVGFIAAIAAIAVRRSPPELRAASVIWLFGWLPVGHLILPLQMVIVADRYILFPTLGVALAIAVGVLRIANPRLRVLLVGVIVAASMMRSFDALTSWRDEPTLWERAVSSNPRDDRAWTNYADSTLAAGNSMAAAEIVMRGLRNVKSARLLMRGGLILLDHGDHDRGVAMLRQAAEASEPRAMMRMALLLAKTDQIDEALMWARRSVRASPHYIAGLRALGTIEAKANHPDLAVAALRHAYELQPYDAENRYNLALALVHSGNRIESRELLQSCVDDPKVGADAQRGLAAIPP